MLPHCACAHAKGNFIAFLSCALERLWFLGCPIVFQRLHASPHPSLQQAFCGMPPLTSQPFGVTCVLKNCESHDLYPFSQERPAVWEELRVKEPNIACTMFLCQDLAFSLAWVQMKICNGSGRPEESLLRGTFSLD